MDSSIPTILTVTSLEALNKHHADPSRLLTWCQPISYKSPRPKLQKELKARRQSHNQYNPSREGNSFQT